MSTWSQARATFGEGDPQDGAGLDQSARFEAVRGEVEAAAAGSAWTGSAAEGYTDENSRQAIALGAMAGLDRRLATEVGRSAAVVAAGRRDLDAVRQWVVDVASTLPRTAAGEQMLWPVVSKGTGEIVEIVQRSHSDLAAIAQRMRALATEYDELGGPKKSEDAEPVSFMSDEGHEKSGDVPETTLDLADIEYLEPGARGRPGMMELVPGSGVWVPDPGSPTYQSKPPEAPLDLNDIEYLGPGGKGQPWQMELVPGSGAWVPDPNYPGYQPRTPEAPVDLAEIEVVDPEALVPADKVELWPHAGILVPNPYAGSPF